MVRNLIHTFAGVVLVAGALSFLPTRLFGQQTYRCCVYCADSAKCCECQAGTQCVTGCSALGTAGCYCG